MVILGWSGTAWGNRSLVYITVIGDHQLTCLYALNVNRNYIDVEYFTFSIHLLSDPTESYSQQHALAGRGQLRCGQLATSPSSFCHSLN